MEKTIKKTQKDLQVQIKMVKDTITKLSDVIMEEFESVREDYQNDLSKYTLPIYQRMQQLEIGTA